MNAFRDHSRHNICYYDLDSELPDIDLEPFDCIIFNFCVWGHSLPEDEHFVSSIGNFKGQKIAIFQDEYDYFLWRKNTIIKMGIDTIVTCVPPEYLKEVFRGEAFERVKFIHALTGYVPGYLLKMPQPKAFEDRTWWIGYRSRPVPFRYGKLTQEKVIIGKRMKEICDERGVPVNIELTEESRIYGREWPQFIRNCRAVLSTESGSNIFDFDGTIAPAIESYLASHPDAEFETVYGLFLAQYEGMIEMNQISPRIFEAIALGTALVMFEGTYSGVVRPWEHYIPLKKDFGNIDVVLKALDNFAELKSMTRRAYKDIIESGVYNYSNYIKEIDSYISDASQNGKASFRRINALMGWRTKNAGLVPVNNWDPSVITNTPFKYSDWHLNLRPYINISFRWNNFVGCLWFPPLSLDKEPVFKVVGWAHKGGSKRLLPAIKNTADEMQDRAVFRGNKYLGIHYYKRETKWSLVVTYSTVRYYFKRLTDWCSGRLEKPV